MFSVFLRHFGDQVISIDGAASYLTYFEFSITLINSNKDDVIT